MLQHDIACCTTCPSLKPWHQFDADAYGTASTGCLLVGEAPGYVSWKNRRRFTGPAGLLIRRALARVGHPRYRDLEDLFYLTDAVKCHPAPAGNPASNRSPRQSEIRTCAGYLERELAVLRPSVIVTFGKTAAEQVGRAIERVLGTGLHIAATVIALPHPSPRNQIAIRKRYRTLQTLERAIARAFRRIIAQLEMVGDRRR